MSQTSSIQSKCCSNKPIYEITYEEFDKKTTLLVCNSCFEMERKSKDYPDTLIKPYQRNAIKIICNSCKEDVTKTIGYHKCHPQKPKENTS